jgi:hypothetical protein
MSWIIVCCLYILPTHALIGAGIQWGFDFTLDMDNTYDDHLSFTQDVLSPNQFISTSSIPNLAYDLIPSGYTVSELSSMINANIETFQQRAPFTLSRSDWCRSKINFGGKIFFDDIPIIDAVEVSFNLGAWEYDAVLKYPSGLMQDSISREDIDEFVTTANYEKILQMDSTHLSLDKFKDIRFPGLFGLTKTPYFKFHLDLTIRKNIVAKPSSTKIFKLYLGGGPSFHLGSPILTSDFVEEVLANTIASAQNNLESLGNNMSTAIMENVLEELVSRSKNPTFGMNIIAGIMVKPPVIPLGFFVDSKLMIPFGDMDENVDLGGVGFVINLGIALSL